jgi:hypothetical protein
VKRIGIDMKKISKKPRIGLEIMEENLDHLIGLDRNTIVNLPLNCQLPNNWKRNKKLSLKM